MQVNDKLEKLNKVRYFNQGLNLEEHHLNNDQLKFSCFIFNSYFNRT